jgi:hypothetical protein
LEGIHDLEDESDDLDDDDLGEFDYSDDLGPALRNTKFEDVDAERDVDDSSKKLSEKEHVERILSSFSSDEVDEASGVSYPSPLHESNDTHVYFYQLLLSLGAPATSFVDAWRKSSEADGGSLKRMIRIFDNACTVAKIRSNKSKK